MQVQCEITCAPVQMVDNLHMIYLKYLPNHVIR